MRNLETKECWDILHEVLFPHENIQWYVWCLRGNNADEGLTDLFVGWIRHLLTRTRLYHSSAKLT